MDSPPSGTVTFLFTDIEASTRRWEAEPDPMRLALLAHDGVLGSAIEDRGGWLFKHTGDGVVAAFSSARSAVEAAMDAQTRLELPVRMGISTGEAEPRGNDYFGPALNRAARVMGAAHAGQILIANSTAGLIGGIDLLDLGEHRLRDLSGPQRLFQVRAEGLRADFPPPKTLDRVPGNLRVQTTSFVGRESELAELEAAIAKHRLVTLTGVGGVGKTRLALQAAAELGSEFPDGVWFVELAPVGDPSSIPDAVATALGVAPRAGMSVTDSVSEALAGGQRLVVLDNCEHVLGAVADLVEAILVRSASPRVVVTSREGLRLPAEHLWPVPSLSVTEGAGSTGVALFVERACAVLPTFELAPHEEAVIDICRRLDGIPLAIELAAARVASMTPLEVRDRLGDRFRLLSGSRRGLERHQTLGHAVQWSYDLLDENERAFLNCCSVFAGGFDLKAARRVAGADADEYDVLDRLDSLVRKSLITASQSDGTTRYALLETIRQFAEDRLAASERAAYARSDHAHYFAGLAESMSHIWASPAQRDANAWIDVELGNLRAAFRWALEGDDFAAAATIAVSVAGLSALQQLFEPTGWVEEVLRDQRAETSPLLRSLYASASLCCYSGRVLEAIEYGEAGMLLADDARFQPVLYGADYVALANALLFADRPQDCIDVCRAGMARAGDPLTLGQVTEAWALAAIGHVDGALSLVDAALSAAERSRIPLPIILALDAVGKTYASSDPARALAARRRALAIARESNNRLYESVLTQELAGMEAKYGDPGAALDTFDDLIDSFHRRGDAHLFVVFAYLAVFFDRIGLPEAAAVLYGASSLQSVVAAFVPEMRGIAQELRTALGSAAFDELADEGAGWNSSTAVEYAHSHIAQARATL